MSKEQIMYDLGLETGEAAAAIVRAVDDGRVSVIEGVSIGKEMLTLGMVAFKNREQLTAGFKDGLSEQEAADLYAGFCTGFDPGDACNEGTVEYYFKVALDSVSTLSGLFIKPAAVVDAPAE